MPFWQNSYKERFWCRLMRSILEEGWQWNGMAIIIIAPGTSVCFMDKPSNMDKAELINLMFPFFADSNPSDSGGKHGWLAYEVTTVEEVARHFSMIKKGGFIKVDKCILNSFWAHVRQKPAKRGSFGMMAPMELYWHYIKQKSHLSARFAVQVLIIWMKSILKHIHVNTLFALYKSMSSSLHYRSTFISQNTGPQSSFRKVTLHLCVGDCKTGRTCSGTSRTCTPNWGPFILTLKLQQ